MTAIFHESYSRIRGRAMLKLLMIRSTLIAVVYSISFAAHAMADVAKQVDVPAGSLVPALEALAKQEAVELFYQPEQLKSFRTRGVKGRYAPQDAVRLLLKGTSLQLRTDTSGAMVISALGTQTQSQPPGVVDGAQEGKSKSSGAFLLAQSTPGQTSSPSAVEEKNTPQPTQATASPAMTLQEVTVTATRREENPQDIPMSLTAIGEAQLQELGAYDFSDFVRSVPGLTFNDNGQNRANFVIRGITSDVTGGSLQQTVGLYIDDMPALDTYAGLSTPDLHLFDVNRVEVLRGPQGTLFGSGAMGGAIRIITNKPDLATSSGTVEVGAWDTDGGTGSYTTNAMINVPLVADVLAVRAVGYFEHDGGWVDNTLLGFHLNSEKLYGGRISAQFVPIRALTITGTITTQNAEPNDASYYTGIVDGTPVRTVATPEFTTSKFTVYNLVADYDFSGVRLRSSTTYADRLTLEQVDQTVVSREIFGAATPPSDVNWNDSSDNFFQELHLYSTGDRKLDWFLGAFYRDQPRRIYNFSWTVPGSQNLFGSGPDGAPNNNVYSYIDNEKTQERALFGELSYKLTKRLEATVGLRYVDDSYVDVNTSSNYLIGGFKQTPLSSTDTKSTYKFAVNYKLTPEAMVYGVASQGYRVGGANPVVPVPTPRQFGPDSLWNYEIGAKTDWLDGALRVNGDLYFIDWQKMQLSVYTPGAEGYEYTANVGTTHSKGAELEVTAAVTRDLEYIGSSSYNDARIQVNNPAIDAAAGDRVPGVPHFTLSNALQYTRVLGRIQAYFHIDEQYITGSLNVFDSTIGVHQGNYNLVNARVGVRVANWDVSLFAKNILNSDAVTTAVPATPTQVFRLQPVTIGVTARTKF
jgi:iron complex outermembrane receptor protein